MSEPSISSVRNNLEVITEALNTGEMKRAANLLNAFHPAEIALLLESCLLYTSPSPRDYGTSRMPSSA